MQHHPMNRSRVSLFGVPVRLRVIGPPVTAQLAQDPPHQRPENQGWSASIGCFPATRFASAILISYMVFWAFWVFGGHSLAAGVRRAEV